MQRARANKIVLVILVVFISAIFITMIQNFLLVIFLAGIFAGMFRPVYKKINKMYKGKTTLASFTTLVLVLFLILLPLFGLLGVVAAQALKISKTWAPKVEELMEKPDALGDALNALPFSDEIMEYSEFIIQKGGEVLGSVSTFIVNNLSTATFSTIQFVFYFFVFLYTLFFFLIQGDVLLERILYYLPLDDDNEKRMLEKFSSVTRATIKGTMLIGLIQGTLAGAAFAVAGISSAIFWGTIMTVLSIIPGIGTALVWIPAVIILAASGKWAAAIGVGVWCVIVVGTVDNILRPILVGRDTKMHELFIFFSTLGGLTMFGVTGFIIGPIIAALFITIWDIYGETFKDILPQVRLFQPETSDKEETETDESEDN